MGPENPTHPDALRGSRVLASNNYSAANKQLLSYQETPDSGNCCPPSFYSRLHQLPDNEGLTTTAETDTTEFPVIYRQCNGSHENAPPLLSSFLFGRKLKTNQLATTFHETVAAAAAAAATRKSDPSSASSLSLKEESSSSSSSSHEDFESLFAGETSSGSGSVNLHTNPASCCAHCFQKKYTNCQKHDYVNHQLHNPVTTLPPSKHAHTLQNTITTKPNDDEASSSFVSTAPPLKYESNNIQLQQLMFKQNPEPFSFESSLNTEPTRQHNFSNLFISQTTVPETQEIAENTTDFCYEIPDEPYSDAQSCDELREKENIFEILKTVKISDSILYGIDHSTKFFDDIYEYRFVVLPRNHPFIKTDNEHLTLKECLSEDEWRLLGIRQTRGWEHIGYSLQESHVLLFRRPIGINVKTGEVESDSIKEKIKSRKRNIDQWMAKASHLRNTIPRSLPYFRTLPTFGSALFTRFTDPTLNPTVFESLLSSHPAQLPLISQNTLGWSVTASPRLLSLNLTRKFTATISSLHLIQPSQDSPFFNLTDEDYQRLSSNGDINESASEIGKENTSLPPDPSQKLIHDLDVLYAAIHMPLYAA